MWVREDLALSLQFMSNSVLPMSSSKSFIVSGLVLRFLIHFEFTFAYGIRNYSNFILLCIAAQFSQHYLLKRLPFLHCIYIYFFAFFVKDKVPIGMSVYLWAFYVVSVLPVL